MNFPLLFVIPFVLVSNFLSGQILSESDIKDVAEKLNHELKGFDSGNGVSVKGCFAFGRTLIYHFDVPENWLAPDNLKEDLISNLKTSGASKSYFLNDIDVDYLYFKGNSLAKKISIKSTELSIYSTNLGEYVSIKDHPKAKGVDLKIKVPIGWEVQEGDRPNVVKKFVKDGNTYQIIIRENMTFFSRNQCKDLFQDEDFVNKYVEETISSLKDAELLEKSIVTIDTYPAIHSIAKGKVERAGLTIPIVMDSWTIFYEDKFVFLGGSGLDNAEFRMLDQLYLLMTNSVIFPDQYK